MTPSDTSTTRSDAGPQHNPSYEASESRLHDAAADLVSAAGLLSASAPEYAGALTNIVWSIRQSYQALLAYHGLPSPEGTPLAETARSAERLASILRTNIDRALPLEPLEAAVRRGRAVDISVREAILTGYHTARNTLATVLGELPEAIGREVRESLRHAEAIRTQDAAVRDLTISHPAA